MEDVFDIAAGCLMLLISTAVGFLIDAGLAQMIIWSLSTSFHIAEGFWPALLLTITVELIVTVGAFYGARAVKK